MPALDQLQSNLAVFGRYIVTESVLRVLERGAPVSGAELQLTTGFAALLDEGPGVYASRFKGESYDCGTPEEYRQSISRYGAGERNPPSRG
jgi:UTP--glucose-1-phosphate uridylyltransferase